MVAEDGRDRDRDTSEERPDFGDREEPVSPTNIVGASGPVEPEAAGEAAEELGKRLRKKLLGKQLRRRLQRKQPRKLQRRQLKKKPQERRLKRKL